MPRAVSRRAFGVYSDLSSLPPWLGGSICIVFCNVHRVGWANHSHPAASAEHALYAWVSPSPRVRCHLACFTFYSLRYVPRMVAPCALVTAWRGYLHILICEHTSAEFAFGVEC